MDKEEAPITYEEYVRQVNLNIELSEKNKQLKAELELRKNALKREHEAIHRANELEDRITKAIEYIHNNYTNKYKERVKYGKIILILEGGDNE